jgi:hypothetical protein
MSKDVGEALEDVEDLDGNVPVYEISMVLKNKHDLSGREAARVVSEYYGSGDVDPESLGKSISRRRIMKKGAIGAGALLGIGAADLGANRLTDDSMVDGWDYMNEETVKEAAAGNPVDVAMLNYSDSGVNEHEVASAFQELGIDLRPNLVDAGDGFPEDFISDATGAENFPDVTEYAETGMSMNDWDGRSGEIPYIVLYDEMPFDAVAGSDDLDPNAQYSFVDSSMEGHLTENEIIRQLGYKFGLKEVNSPVYGDLDVMGSSPLRDELGKHTALSFTEPSENTWKRIREQYSD